MLLSEHTLLINNAICLARKQNCINNILSDNGYDLDYIGPRIPVSDGEVVPDVTFKSTIENLLLIIECKSGSIDYSQALRYKNLTEEDIITSNITSLDSKIKI